MNKDLETILDTCIEERRNGRSIDHIAADHPEHADELRALLPLAADLEELPDAEPTVHGMIRTMVDLTSSEREARRKPKALRLFSIPAISKLAATVALVGVLMMSTMAAAANTIPGDFLYPLKRLGERVSFFLTVNEEDQVEMRILFSEKRIAEAVRKHARGEGLDEELLATMLEEARLAVEDAGDLPETERLRLVTRASTATAYQKQLLSDLKEWTPQQEHQQIDQWIERCGSRREWMHTMCQDIISPQERTTHQRGSWRDRSRRSCPTW